MGCALSGRFANVSRHAGADGIVIVDFADGVQPASSGTGIGALLPDAGQTVGTVRVDDTLGPQRARGASDGRRWGGRIFGLDGRHDDGHERAEVVSVARVSVEAGAHWIVADDHAAGVLAASSRTGVAAFLVDARQRRLALRVGGALGSAAFGALRVAEESGTAGADGVVGRSDGAVGVRSARRRPADVDGRLAALAARIHDVAGLAETFFAVEIDDAVSVQTARSGAAKFGNVRRSRWSCRPSPPTTRWDTSRPGVGRRSIGRG